MATLGTHTNTVGDLRKALAPIADECPIDVVLSSPSGDEELRRLFLIAVDLDIDLQDGSHVKLVVSA